MGAFGAGQAGGHAGQIERDDLRVIDLARQRHAEQALGLEVRLEGFDLGFGAARAFEVGDGFFIDRKKAMVAPYSGAMLAMVARSGSASVRVPSPEEFHKLAHHLVLAQQLGHGEHQVGGRHALRAVGRSAHRPTTSGVKKYTGWPSMAASASMPPTPQPTTPMPLIMVVWLSVPTRVSG